MINQVCASLKDKILSFFSPPKASVEKQSHMGVEDRRNQRLWDMKNVRVVCVFVCVPSSLLLVCAHVDLCVFVCDMGLDLSLGLQLQ